VEVNVGRFIWPFIGNPAPDLHLPVDLWPVCPFRNVTSVNPEIYIDLRDANKNNWMNGPMAPSKFSRAHDMAHLLQNESRGINPSKKAILSPFLIDTFKSPMVKFGKMVTEKGMLNPWTTHQSLYVVLAIVKVVPVVQRALSAPIPGWF